MLGYRLGLWPNGAPQTGPIAPPPPPPPPPDGSAVGYNLGVFQEFSPNKPFLNLCKQATRWSANNGADFTKDADNYPTGGLPAGVSFFSSTLFFGGNETSFRQPLRLRWTGDGAVSVAGNVTGVSASPNQIDFEIQPFNSTIEFRITDLGTTGVGDMSLVRHDRLAAYDAGDVYEPSWFSKVQIASQLRFLNWLPINGATLQREWVDRPLPTHWSYENNMPFEVIVDICNQAGADLWMELNHLFDETYVKGIAAIVRDNLNPALTVKVESSNETWNSGFSQTEYFYARGAEYFGGTQLSGTMTTERNSNVVTGVGTAFTTELASDPNIIGIDGQFFQLGVINSDTQFTASPIRVGTKDASGLNGWYGNSFLHRPAFVKESTQQMQWWSEVMTDRVVYTIGAQFAASGDSKELLDAAVWQSFEPAEWVDPTTTFDSVSLGIYFGGAIVNDAAKVAALQAALDAGDDTVTMTLLDDYLHETGSETFPRILQNLRIHYRECTPRGVYLDCYEFNQHISYTGPTTAAENTMLAVVNLWRTQDICVAHYREAFELYRAFVDAPLNFFDLIHIPGGNGHWGAYTHLDDTPDKVVEFIEWAKDQPRWWGQDVVPVVIKPLPSIVADEFEAVAPVELDVHFSANARNYVATGLPAGLSVDPQTGTLSGTLADGAAGVGTYTITVETDAGPTSVNGDYDVTEVVQIDPMDPQYNGIMFIDPTDETTITATSPPTITSVTDRIGGFVYPTAGGTNPQTGVADINGQNVISCTTDRFSIAGAPHPVDDLAAEFSLYFVYQRTNVGNTAEPRAFHFGNTSTQFSLGVNNNGDLTFYLRTSTGSYSCTVTPVAGLNDVRRVSVRYDGANLLVDVNGVANSVPVTGNVDIANDFTRLASGTSTSAITGLIGGLWIGDTAHSDTVKGQFEDYFETVFAIA